MQALRKVLSLGAHGGSCFPTHPRGTLLLRFEVSPESKNPGQGGSNRIIGHSILKEDLFKYTNGRFLAEEKDQLSKRFVQFDVDRLCDVIAGISRTGARQVSKIEKMEGGFSKALLMTTMDGSEYIVKIPCPNAGRPMYCTASEVAVLNFGKIDLYQSINTRANKHPQFSQSPYHNSRPQGPCMERRFNQPSRR